MGLKSNTENDNEKTLEKLKKEIVEILERDKDIFKDKKSFKDLKEEIEFSTPLLPDLVGLEVGDIATINYPKYSLLLDVQITQKQIGTGTIKFKCKEI